MYKILLAVLRPCVWASPLSSNTASLLVVAIVTSFLVLGPVPSCGAASCDNCLDCVGGSLCIRCDNSTILDEFGQCVSSCAMPNNIGTRAVTTSTEDGSRSCLAAVCPDTYFVDYPDATTVQCTLMCSTGGEFCQKCVASDESLCAQCDASKYLDGGTCKDGCRAKTEEGEDDYRTIITPPGKVCASYVAPTNAPGLTQETIYIIAGAAGGAVLLIVSVLLYIWCDRRRTGDLLDMAQNGAGAQTRPDVDLELTSMSIGGAAGASSTDSRPSSVSSESSVGESGISEDQREAWKSTMRRAAGASKSVREVDVEDVSPATALEIDSVAMVTITQEEKEEYITALNRLRKDRNIFALMLKEYRKREQEAGNEQKYTRLCADLTRLLRLFKLDKRTREAEAPVDGMELISWGEKALNKYLTRGAAKMSFSDGTSSSREA
eukprot:UC1_evm6s808